MNGELDKKKNILEMIMFAIYLQTSYSSSIYFKIYIFLHNCKIFFHYFTSILISQYLNNNLHSNNNLHTLICYIFFSVCLQWDNLCEIFYRNEQAQRPRGPYHYTCANMCVNLRCLRLLCSFHGCASLPLLPPCVSLNLHKLCALWAPVVKYDRLFSPTAAN